MPAMPESLEVEGNWPQRFIQCGGDALSCRIEVWPRSIDGWPLCAIAFVPVSGVRGSPVPVSGQAEIRRMSAEGGQYEMPIAPGSAGMLLVGIQPSDRLDIREAAVRLRLPGNDRLLRARRAVDAFLATLREGDETWELYVVHRG